MKQQVESQAKVKLPKVEEPLTGGADGNLEPSMSDSSDRACVETRRGVCIKCGNVVPQTKYKNAKFCSNKCRSAYNSYKSRLKKGDFKKPGVGSGGNQLGTGNHMYKTGIGSYSKRAFAFYPNICNRCSSMDNLLVHHRNHDRIVNDLENLEILCKRCHQEHHAKRDIQGKYTKG